MKRNMQWVMAAALLISGSTMALTSCSNKDNAATDVKDGADLVVYGKIYTAEAGQIVEAFAVRGACSGKRPCGPSATPPAATTTKQ